MRLGYGSGCTGRRRPGNGRGRFFTKLTNLREEVKRHRRTVLQTRADELIDSGQADLVRPASVDSLLASVWSCLARVFPSQINAVVCAYPIRPKERHCLIDDLADLAIVRKIMDTNRQRQRRPASTSIWYVLATVAGEPTGVQDVSQVSALNRYYWNGLMADRVAVYDRSRGLTIGDEIEFPKLTSDDHQKIRQALDSRGFSGHPIPQSNSPIDFADVEFPGMTSFMGFVIGGETRFDRAKFPDAIAFFNEVIFAGNISFDDAEFYGDFVAIKSEFKSFITFSGATFSRTAGFFACKFRTAVGFENVHFMGDAYFRGCKFRTNVRFENAHFMGDAYFNSCTFRLEARFSNAAFEQEADFGSAEFQGPTHFLRTKFKTRIPGFFEATLHEYTEWHGSAWPQVPINPDDGRDQVQRYQRLTRLMNGREKFNDQHFFFRKELRAQRRADGWSIAGAMNSFYGLVCEYGYGLSRIATIWLAHVMLAAVALWGIRVLDASEHMFPWREAYSSIGDFPDALAISFANAHALLNLSGRFLKDTEKGWEGVALFNVIGITQTVLGVIILFFLILTIRNRFRMR